VLIVSLAGAQADSSFAASVQEIVTRRGSGSSVPSSVTPWSASGSRRCFVRCGRSLDADRRARHRHDARLERALGVQAITAPR
jgi:hypothetical protein